ncbi:MAG: CheR family methyltransferase [Gemmatimonadales bacterium]
MIAATAGSGIARVHAHLATMGLEALSLYKEPCFGRRLASRLRACGDATVEAYADRLDQEPAERERLVAALSIGVTAFFRNPEAWRRLAAAIDAAGPMARFHAWSAGCSTGEEAYSIALLIHRLAERGTLGDWRVVATDLDQRALATAREGRYPRRDLAAIEAVVGPIEAAVDDRSILLPVALRGRIVFRRADLTRPGPVGQFDLVSCRNVLIYFGTAGQEQVVANLVRSLRLGGLLMLGKAELAAGAASAGLEVVDRRERIYRRVA